MRRRRQKLPYVVPPEGHLVIKSYVVLQAQLLKGNGDLKRIRSALAVERNVMLLCAHGGRKEECY